MAFIGTNLIMCRMARALQHLELIVFKHKAQIIFKLRDLAYQTGELIPFRQRLVNEMLAKVQALNWAILR